MSLHVAECPRCQGPIIYGEAACTTCGQAFDYGASPPPVPPADEARRAKDEHTRKKAEQARREQKPAATPRASSPPSSSPPSSNVPRADAGRPASTSAPSRPSPKAGVSDFVDTGRFDDATARPVTTDQVQGLIDSRLFAAYTPKSVEVQRIAELERTGLDDSARAAPVRVQRLEVERSEQEPARDVRVEAVPGLVDSSLFARFTKSETATGRIEGLEPTGVTSSSSSSSNDTPAKAKRPRRGDEESTVRCAQCGLAHRQATCPSCGTLRPR